MKVIVSHPTGNRNVRAVLSSLSDAGMLAKFFTTISTDTNAPWLRLVPGRVREEWLRRVFPLAARQVGTRPGLEISRMLFSRIGPRAFVQPELGWAGIDAVYKDLDRSTARQLARVTHNADINAVYAYEDGALETFRQAKRQGLRCIYDLPIAYWETVRKLLLEERERLPAWAPTLGGGITDSPEKLDRKTKELELADVVITPGKFVAQSIPYWARNKTIVTSAFGSPTGTELTPTSNRRGPLRVLFAGSMGQRKGLGDLFQAIRLLKSREIELVVMGSMLAPETFYRKQLPRFTYEPGRPNAQVLALMQTCDVLCLPSIVEGRALVMQEAMSSGLPLVITPNTGGEDLVKEGETGFLVPIRSPAHIAAKLSWFLEKRSRLREMSEQARLHAARYSWEQYGSTIIQALLDPGNITYMSNCLRQTRR